MQHPSDLRSRSSWPTEDSKREPAKGVSFYFLFLGVCYFFFFAHFIFFIHMKRSETGVNVLEE